MPQHVERTTDLKIFIGLGVIGLLVFITLPIIALTQLSSIVDEDGRVKCVNAEGAPIECEGAAKLYQSFHEELVSAASQETTAESSSTAGLGSEGSICGGVDRFPCMPGLRCMVEEGATTGVCMSNPVEEVFRVRMKDDACGSSIGWCALGLVCKLSPGNSMGVCIDADDESATVLTLTLEGMTHDEDTYRAEVGSDIFTTVQAVNAVSARLIGGSVANPVSKDLSRADGGVFSGEWTVPPQLSGDLWVVVNDSRGQVSAMSVKVGTK